MKKIYLCLIFSLCPFLILSSLSAQEVEWLFLEQGETFGTCTSETNYSTSTICYGLEYTPSVTGTATSYTFAFYVECVGGVGGDLPINLNQSSSCLMDDNSIFQEGCQSFGLSVYTASGNGGNVPISAGVPIIFHQVCMNLSLGQEALVEIEPTVGISIAVDSAGAGGPIVDNGTFESFTADDSGFGIVPCTDSNICSLEFGDEEDRLEFTFNANGLIADASTLENSLPDPMHFDVYDEANEICQYAGGMDDLTLTFEIINTVDQNGNGIIDQFAGMNQHITRSVDGLMGQIPFAQSASDETSSGDVRGYSMRVDFANHIEIVAGQLTVNLQGVNSPGAAFESARLQFFGVDGLALGNANYQGFYNGTTDLNGSCTSTAASNPWNLSGGTSGVVVFDNTNTVDLSNPCGPVAGAGNSDLVMVSARFDAGLDSSTVIQGFSLVVVGEDVAAPSQLDNGSNMNGEDNIVANRNTSTSGLFDATLLGYTVDGCVFKSNILPVDYLSLNALAQEKSTLLKWVTATEINHSHFLVEWSVDGHLFQKLAVANDGVPDGNYKAYNYIHESPSHGVNYYRLKQVDYDGHYEYSDVQKVFFEGEVLKNISIYPNPATEQISINLSEVKDYPIPMELISIRGQVIRSEMIYPGKSVHVCDISNLEKGLYLIRINGQTNRFIKQ